MNQVKRALGTVCFVIALTGCATTDLSGLLLWNTASTGEQVVAGSLEMVAKSTQSTLHRLGLQAVTTPVGDAVYISSASKSGERFTLILTREQTEQGEKTRIRLEWLEDRNDRAGREILAELTNQQKKT